MCNICQNFAVVSHPIAGPMSTISLGHCLLSQSRHGAIYSIGLSLYRRYIRPQIQSFYCRFYPENQKFRHCQRVQSQHCHHHHADLQQQCPRHNSKLQLGRC